MSGRGSDAVQCLVVQSVDLGRLEGVLIRRSILVSCVLVRSGLFGGESCRKDDGTGACPLLRFP